MIEPENHTLVLLRELRADMARTQDQMRVEFEAVNKRLDAMHQNSMKAPKSFIGHRAMASFETEPSQRRERVDLLEAATS